MKDIQACPRCDGTHIFQRQQSSIGGRPADTDHKFRCEDCGLRFDEPMIRKGEPAVETTAESILERIGVNTDQLPAFDDDAEEAL